ncbi:zinc dependent phospholipase C family protein [Aquirufa rosea]|uniref:S1/P1 Nuclease n=1 Tax=Aquirufa rosea TaxID=2509241 RepID=A0A4Q1C1R1_9BACT|nr:zinc dependent phospholipase C family protein [Aquirufa rosea]RXK52116.1 S1/P1 Nuclease [Aquirufa rosea]
MIHTHKILSKKSLIFQIHLSLCLLLSYPSYSLPWGFFAHKKVNRLAVFTLPASLSKFYKRHLKAMEEWAVLPDQRRYVLDQEAARHYIDLDLYPIQIAYTSIQQAKKIVTEDSLQKHGIVPWHIIQVHDLLIQAFSKNDTTTIIKLSAELGHYVADAHVPLHTTSNYDGQKTGQQGLHSFWESRIPELMDSGLEDWVGAATFVENPLQSCWKWVLQAHQMVPILLKKEKEIHQITPENRIYTFEKKGNSLIKTYSRNFSLAYHHALDGQIEQQFKSAVLHLGDLLFTAWILGGQSDFK